MPSSHLILCRPLLLLPPIPPSIRVFSNESTLRMRWPKYWVSALASFLPKKSQGWSPSEWTGWVSLQSKGLSRVFNTTVQKHQFFSAQLYSLSNSHIHTKTERSSVWQMFPFVFYSSEIILVSMTRYLFPKTLCRNTLKLSIPWLLLCGLPTLCQWNFLNEADLNLGRWCRISSLSY